MNAGYSGVMNNDRFARVTLVLDRSTDDALNYLSRRLHSSKSALVREVLAEPVEAMRGLLVGFPEGEEIDPRQLALAGLDLIDSVVSEPLTHLRETANG